MLSWFPWNNTQFKTMMVKIYTCFLTKMAKKTIPFGAAKPDTDSSHREVELLRKIPAGKRKVGPYLSRQHFYQNNYCSLQNDSSVNCAVFVHDNDIILSIIFYYVSVIPYSPARMANLVWIMTDRQERCARLDYFYLELA